MGHHQRTILEASDACCTGMRGIIFFRYDQRWSFFHTSPPNEKGIPPNERNFEFQLKHSKC